VHVVTSALLSDWLEKLGTDNTDMMSQALRIACWNGQDAVVEWLLAHTAADVTSYGVIRKDYGAMTPLIAASYAAHTCVIKTLLPFVQPDSVNTACMPSQNTALHYAIWCESKIGFSPLHVACAEGDIDDVAHILNY
jgi:ankyrin repeat protein